MPQLPDGHADGYPDGTTDFPPARPVSPRRLFLVTLGTVFVVELLIMIWLELIWAAPEMWEVVIDSLVLAVVIAPLLYWTLYRPLNRYVEQVRKAGEALRYSEKKYHTVVEHSPAGIFIYRDGEIVFANQRLTEMFGISASELVGLDPREYVAEEDREQLRALVNPAGGERGESPEVEFRVTPPSGPTRWVNARSTLVRYKGATSVLGMVLDVTERRNLEDELRQVSAQRLHVQEEERARLARELHDGVGQSLSAIKFLVEHTLGQAYPNERRGQMERMRALVPKIQDTVEDVRRMSMALRPSTMDDLGVVATITWFLREMKAACPNLIVEHRLEVEEPQVPEPLKIVIYRTLQEALNNAAKHCGDCRVDVVLERSDSHLRLDVTDDGLGFDLDAVRSRAPDTRGFGLASMRERVELSGGVFAIHSEPGGGTRVRAEWPMPAEAVSC